MRDKVTAWELGYRTLRAECNMPSTPKKKNIKKQSNPTQIRPASITTTTTDEDIEAVRKWGSALSTPTKSLLEEKSEVLQSPKQIKQELRYSVCALASVCYLE